MVIKIGGLPQKRYINDYIVIPLICITLSIILFIINIEENYRLLFMLPLSYAVVSIFIFPKIRKSCPYNRGLVYMIVQSVLTYRYLLLPFALVYTHYSGGWTSYSTYGFGVEPYKSSIDVAIILMCLELVMAEIAILLSNVYLKKKINTNEKRICIRDEREFLKNKVVVFSFIICAFVILAIYQPHLFRFNNFLVLSENYTLRSNSEDGSFFKVINIAFKTSILLLIYSLFVKIYSSNHSKMWVYMSVMVLVVYVGMSMDVSRWNIILPCIASFVIFFDIFRPFPKSILLPVVIVLFIGIFSITFFKYGYLIHDQSNVVFKMVLLVFQQSNEYFSGPRSIAQGIETLNLYEDRISISTIFNSFFSGFAGFASLTSDSDKLQSYFNYYNLGIMVDNPLIVPSVIEGLAFFPIFPWIFTCVFMFLACVMDYKGQNCKVVEYRYIFVYIGCWFALCLCVNTKIIISQLSTLLIPCGLLFYVNRRFKIGD